MSILDRLLLALLSIGALIVGVGAFLGGIGVMPADWTTYTLDVLYRGPAAGYLIVGGIVLTILALRFLFYRLGAREPEYVVLQGAHGVIRISFETIKQLAQRIGKSVRGVQDLDTRVRNDGAGVTLSVRVRVAPDVEIPKMSSEIQTAIKTYVEDTTGVTCTKVTVNVTELATSTPKGARAWVE